MRTSLFKQIPKSRAEKYGRQMVTRTIFSNKSPVEVCRLPWCNSSSLYRTKWHKHHTATYFRFLAFYMSICKTLLSFIKCYKSQRWKSKEDNSVIWSGWIISVNNFMGNYYLSLCYTQYVNTTMNRKTWRKQIFWHSVVLIWEYAGVICICAQPNAIRRYNVTSSLIVWAHIRLSLFKLHC